jgi:hypothetical protein
LALCVTQLTSDAPHSRPPISVDPSTFLCEEGSRENEE